MVTQQPILRLPIRLVFCQYFDMFYIRGYTTNYREDIEEPLYSTHDSRSTGSLSLNLQT